MTARVRLSVCLSVCLCSRINKGIVKFSKSRQILHFFLLFSYFLENKRCCWQLGVVQNTAAAFSFSHILYITHCAYFTHVCEREQCLCLDYRERAFTVDALLFPAPVFIGVSRRERPMIDRRGQESFHPFLSSLHLHNVCAFSTPLTNNTI